MKRFIIFIVVFLVAGWLCSLLMRALPRAWDPFAVLSVTDGPTWVTRYKLARLAANPEACFAVLRQAQKEGYLSYTRPGTQQGRCPLIDPVRITRFGDVTLSTTFFSSCALAVRSTMLVTQVLKPLAISELGTPLTRIDHLGSYACRNIYHRAEGRLSEHATADAWDLSGFRLQNGERISVLAHWSAIEKRSRWLHLVFARSCDLYGSALGPEYNAAHASHFHFGTRGFGLCR